MEGERNGLAGYPADFLEHCDKVEMAARSVARRRVDLEREAEAIGRVVSRSRSSTPGAAPGQVPVEREERMDTARVAVRASALERGSVPLPVRLVDGPGPEEASAGAVSAPTATATAATGSPAGPSRRAGGAGGASTATCHATTGAGTAAAASGPRVNGPSAAGRAVDARAAPTAGPAAAVPGRTARQSGAAKTGKGKGRVWTTAERVALCEAFKINTLDAVAGTSQTSNTLWAKVWFSFASRTPPNLPASELNGRWSNRPPTSAKTEFLRNIGPCSQRFAHFYHVASTQLTGNMTEESVLRSARCLYTATGAYSAERKDIDYEMVLKEQGKSPPVRRARLLPENWQPCWQVLRTLDKWSGASANPEMEKLFLDDAEDEDSSGDESESVATVDGTSSKGKRKRSDGGPQQTRPPGHRAAKRAAKASKEDKTSLLEESLASSDKAMKSIAASMAKKAELADAAYQIESRREAIEFFNRPENRNTDEGKQFRALMMRRMVNLGRTVTQQVIHERTTVTSDGTTEPSTAPGAVTASDAGSRSGGAGSPAARARGANAMATKAKNARAAADAQSVDLTTPPNGRTAGTPAIAGPASGGVRGGSDDGPVLEAELDDEEKGADTEVDFDVRAADEGSGGEDVEAAAFDMDEDLAADDDDDDE